MGNSNSGGHNRKPAKLKLLEGKRGHRPIGKDLSAPSDPMRMPQGLSSAERRAWKAHALRVDKLGIASSVDAGAFEAMIKFYAEAREADRVIARDGRWLRVKVWRGSDEKGQIVDEIKTHPAVAVRRESWKAYCVLCQRWGLDPIGRAKLGQTAGAKEDDDPLPERLRDVSKHADGR